MAPEVNKKTLERTANSLKAIAHPIRLAMIDLLKDGNSLNVTQIYQSLDLEQAVASQHLSILKEKGILSSKRQGKHSFYFISHASISEIIALAMSGIVD